MVRSEGEKMNHLRAVTHTLHGRVPKGCDTKRNYLIALAITATCGLVLFGEPAQGGSVTVFNDTFGSGSTLNQAPTTPTTHSTSYEFGVGIVPSPTNTGYSSISTNDLSLTLPSTTSVLGEIQARFSSLPVTLVTPGDYVNLMVTFVDTANILSGSAGSNSTLNIGLYNSGGSDPQQGPITFASTTNPTGGAQNWQGYVGRFIYVGTSELFTRPAQTNATSAQNQELLFNGASTDQSFNGPKGFIFGTQQGGPPKSLTNLSTYTMNFRTTRNGVSGITVSNALFYSASTNGTQMFGLGATTNSVLTTQLDGLAVGWRYLGLTPTNSTMDIQSITVTYGFGNSWINGAGKWETCIPSIADSAEIITNADSKTVTIDATTSGNYIDAMAINNLIVAGPGAATNTLLLDNAGTLTPLQILGVVLLGTNGAMVINNSTVLGYDSVSIGDSSPSSSLVVSNGGSLIVTNGSGTGNVVVNGGSLLLGPSTFQTDHLVVTNGGVVQHAQTYRLNNATVTVASGAVQAGMDYVVASMANSTATVSLVGGQLLVTNGVLGIGNTGTYTDGNGVGQMTVSNATVTAQSILLGSSLGGHGVLTINADATIYIPTAKQGNPAAGMKLNDCILNGGAIDSPDNDMYAGQGAPGEMIINDGTATFRSAFVGIDNTGSLSMPGGTMSVLSNLVVGVNPGGTGVVMITGGSLTATNGVIGVGNDGTSTNGLGVGTMAVSDGTVTAASILLGSSAGGQGVMTLDTGGSIASAGTNAILICNDFGQIGGNLSWTNIGSAMYCGYAHPGAYALSNGTASCQDLYVGYDNAGTMTIAGGTMTILSGLTVGHLGSPMSTGAVWITGGQLTMVNQPAIIGNSGVGQMSISNGTVTAASVFVGNNSSNPGTLTVAGGTMTVLSGLTVGDCGFGYAGVVTVAGGNLYVTNATHDATLDVRSGQMTLSGGLLQVDKLVMTNSCGLFIRGSGTLIVGSLLLDPNLDADGDGMPNGWELAHGLDPLNAADANVDTDGDGFTNLQEFKAGTDPNDPGSTPLRITAIARENNNIRVTWNTFAGTTNALQATTGAANGSYAANGFANIFSVTNAAGSVTNYLDSGGATNSPSRFYRVRLVP